MFTCGLFLWVTLSYQQLRSTSVCLYFAGSCVLMEAVFVA